MVRKIGKSWRRVAEDGDLGVFQPLQRLVSHQQAGADKLVGHGSSPLFIQAVAVYGIGGYDFSVTVPCEREKNSSLVAQDAPISFWKINPNVVGYFANHNSVSLWNIKVEIFSRAIP